MDLEGAASYEELTAKHPERTLFTRFIPAARPGQGRGMWAGYYRRWANVTLSQIDVGLIELVPQLLRFCRLRGNSTSMSIRLGPKEAG